MKRRGFSLVEVMIVVALLGILAALGVPTFDSMIKNNRRAAVSNELVAILLMARGEAAKRGQAVSVCGMGSSPTACSGTTDWSRGWIVFVDGDANGALASASDILRRSENTYVQIRVSAPVALVMRPFNQGITPGTATICDQRDLGHPDPAEYARAVVVTGSGRAYVSETDAAGAALSCA